MPNQSASRPVSLPPLHYFTEAMRQKLTQEIKDPIV